MYNIQMSHSSRHLLSSNLCHYRTPIECHSIEIHARGSSIECREHEFEKDSILFHAAHTIFSFLEQSYQNSVAPLPWWINKLTKPDAIPLTHDDHTSSYQTSVSNNPSWIIRGCTIQLIWRVFIAVKYTAYGRTD